jgi:hypothetical protein
MKLSTKEFAVRLGQDEIGRILNLKGSVDHNSLWVDFVNRYQSLGWVLVAMNAKGETNLDLDFSQPQDLWSQRLADLGLADIQVNVGIRTGKASRLLVLEVNQGEGALALDQLGEWRAQCVAEVGDSREQHYYSLPPKRPVPPSFFLAPQVLIYGEGGLVLAPPSIEPQSREPWRWRRPPWESPLHPPQPAVWQFIREHLSQTANPAAGAESQVLAWEEIYRLIAPHDLVLRALLVPAPSLEAYYYGVLATALGVGIRDPEVLLGLLWHAPHGDSRTRPSRWKYLHDLVTKALKPAGSEEDWGDLSQMPGVPAVIGAPETWSWPEQALVNAGLELMPTPGSEGGSEPSSGAFEPSVSGQFFQLLAGLGEKVIVESCRVEALRAGLEAGAAEFNRLTQEWDQRFCPPRVAPQEQEKGEVEKNQTRSSDIVHAWTSVMPTPASQSVQYREVQTAANDFLNRNPDLAADRQKILMVIFCLKNYVAINPEFATLPFREKLEKAGHMARGFLGEKDPILEVS